MSEEASTLRARAGWAAFIRSRAATDPALAAGLGVLGGFSQAPTSSPIAALIAIAGAVALMSRAPSPRAAALLGWALGFGYFLPGLLWIGEAFLVDAERFAWLRPFAITLLPAGLALFWAAAFGAAEAASRRAAKWRGAGPPSAATRALFLAALWAAAEWARGHVLTGFPWGLFAYAWVDTPVAQTAAWIGPYALNAATLLAGCALGAAVLSRARVRLAALAAAAAVLAGLLGLGALRLSGAEPVPAAADGDGPLIRLVQPNVPQREKWAPDFRARNIQRLVALSQSEGPDAPTPALIVWPETATPFMIDREHDFRPQLMAALPAGARLVLGALRFEDRADATQDWYNSLLVLAPGGAVEAIYDKHHLVPFGEYLPFQEILQSLGVFQLAGGAEGFVPGPGPRTLSPEGGPSFAPLICYEAVFPHEKPSPAARPEMLLQVTNDAWFGDSGGPRQHLVQARFRAIEQGLPFFRSANTGVSAAIDAYGRVLAQLDVGEMGAVDARLPAALAPPLYFLYGEWAMTLLLPLLLAAAVASARARA